MRGILIRKKYMGKWYFEKMKFPCMKLFVGACYIRIRPEYLDQSLLAKQKQEENHSAKQAPTVPTFNSCTKCQGCPGKIYDRTSDRQPVSCSGMLGWHRNWTKLWFAIYVGHCCAWLIFRHVIHVCVYNQALADARSTDAGIKCLYCIYPVHQLVLHRQGGVSC